MSSQSDGVRDVVCVSGENVGGSIASRVVVSRLKFCRYCLDGRKAPGNVLCWNSLCWGLVAPMPVVGNVGLKTFAAGPIV